MARWGPRAQALGLNTGGVAVHHANAHDSAYLNTFAGQHAGSIG